MTSEQITQTVSDIWGEAIAYARAYEPIEPYAPGEASAIIRKMAVFRALSRIKDAGLAVEVLYSKTPEAATKTYYKAVGTVAGVGYMRSFDTAADRPPKLGWMIAPLTGVFGTTVAEDFIYDLQAPA